MATRQLIAAALCALAVTGRAELRELLKASVTLNAERVLGPVKAMNAVNNGPVRERDDQKLANFTAFKALEVPYARLHDSTHAYAYGGPHVVDIHVIFSDFARDADDPAAYDFTLTDDYLATIREAGTEPFYRLGASIEHWRKRYGAKPPADFGKWAKVCEHVVRHYNEGWANGFKWNLKYWEIWNEPDNGPDSPTWTGTEQEYFDLYRVTATHLKKCFPELKVGGPALSWKYDWADRFLAYASKNKVPLDFFSWHDYGCRPRDLEWKVSTIRDKLDKNGYANAESIIDEWNYVRGWRQLWPYSLRVESGDLNYKGAAYVAAVFCVCQRQRVDMLMYYDARVGCGMNGMFDKLTLEPLHGYYPFYAWMKLRRLGQEVEVRTDDASQQLYAAAARGKDGRLGVLLVRYDDNDNEAAPMAVDLNLGAGTWTAHVTDRLHMYTEMPFGVDAEGRGKLKLQPLSFAYLEQQ